MNIEKFYIFYNDIVTIQRIIIRHFKIDKDTCLPFQINRKESS